MPATSLRELLKNLAPIATLGELPSHVTGITQVSRLIEPGNVFAVRSGSKSTGFEYVNDAVARGASVLLTAESLPEGISIPAIRVKEFRPALVTASHQIYGNPSRKLGLLGVTGTNGKTSTAHMLRSIFEAAGENSAMLTTVGYWTGKRFLNASLTTPDIDRICGILAEGVESGCRWAAMEVSSHALDQGRVNRLNFRVAGFTNLTQDHLDYHGSMEDYFEAKLRLFRGMSCSSTAVVNINSSWGAKAARSAWGGVVTVGSDMSGADMTVTTLEHSVKGARYRLTWLGEAFDVETSLIGTYQGENIALASAMALSCGVDKVTVAKGIKALQAVPGRMEGVSYGQPFALFVDYSHTPDALKRALMSLKPLASGRLVVIFGCGGDRDRSKRPLMGKIAAEMADTIIITSDNPRTEVPQTICQEIEQGVPKELKAKVRVIVDRKEATIVAIAEAKPGDVLLLAGKGSETYVEVNGVRSPYDDRLAALEALHSRGYESAAVQ